jgi:hypothetical protein
MWYGVQLNLNNENDENYYYYEIVEGNNAEDLFDEKCCIAIFEDEDLAKEYMGFMEIKHEHNHP